jgi:hypothetical protein
MNGWDELFNKHPIHETLKWMRDCVAVEYDDLDKDEINEKRRLIKIITKYESALSNIDTETIPFNQLDSLNTGLRNPNIANQINSYKEKGDVANLAAANNQLSNQLTPLALLCCLNGVVSDKNALQDIEILIDSSINSLVQKKDSLEDSLNKLQSVSDEQTAKLTELATLITKNKSEADSLIP